MTTCTCPKRSIAGGTIDLVTGWPGRSCLGRDLESGRYVIYVNKHDNVKTIRDIGLSAIVQREKEGIRV